METEAAVIPASLGPAARLSWAGTVRFCGAECCGVATRLLTRDRVRPRDRGRCSRPAVCGLRRGEALRTRIARRGPLLSHDGPAGYVKKSGHSNQWPLVTETRQIAVDRFVECRSKYPSRKCYLGSGVSRGSRRFRNFRRWDQPALNAGRPWPELLRTAVGDPRREGARAAVRRTAGGAALEGWMDFLAVSTHVHIGGSNPCEFLSGPACHRCCEWATTRGQRLRSMRDPSGVPTDPAARAVALNAPQTH